MLQEGKKYEAILTDAGLQDVKGQPEPFMAFEIEDAGTKHTVYWQGYINKSEKAQELAIKALLSAGFMGNDFPDLQNGFSAVTFQMNKKITVTLEAYKKDGVPTGKFKVAWVNEAGVSNKFAGVAPKLASKFASVRASLGLKKPAAATTKEEAPF